ncbi:MAG TPA: flagellar hook-basal body complex protein FliE [Verrucomicrobiae bacterium]|nr:flagellar hook-basal body complex protein FliE [Verrucomicrobiae bacterium]
MPNVDAMSPDKMPISPDTMPVPDLTGPSELTKPIGSTGIAGVGGTQDSFASMFGRMVEEVNAKQNVATNSVNALQSGQSVPLHQTVIAMEEASVSFQLMVEVRNRLLESYQEVMRMQV